MKSTPDICDAHDVAVIDLPFRDFGRRTAFHGRVVTVSCFEDNSKVKQLLATDGTGRVLLVDGQGSMRRALLGDNLARAAMDNGWRGVVVVGPIRDCEIIEGMDVGVKALGTHPMKTKKEDRGEVDVPVHVGGVDVHPGDHLIADRNGVVVSRTEIPLD